jgi:hypothetical protein
MTGDLMSVFRDAPNPPPPTQIQAPGTPLGDPRSVPSTRTRAETMVTSGRGQAPNIATFAGGVRQS